MSLRLRITVDEVPAARGAVETLRAHLRDRRRLHASIAGEAEKLTTRYLRGLNRHATARRLGAKPTHHYENAARGVESASDQSGAEVRIPRSTGLARAFGDLVIRPGSGRTYLTLPAHRRTYGKRAREFDLDFRIVGGRHAALVFASGDTDAGTVAFWLRKMVRIPQDRSLLPSDRAYTAAAEGAADRYAREILGGRKGGRA